MTGGTVNVPYPVDLAMCPLPGQPSHGVAYLTDPLEEPVVVGGNPFADLRITSSKPGGLITVELPAVAVPGAEVPGLRNVAEMPLLRTLA